MSEELILIRLGFSGIYKYMTIENYSEPIRCDRNRHGSRVAVFLKSLFHIVSELICRLFYLEIVCIEVKPKCSSPFVRLAWYKPPKYDTFSFAELEHVPKVLDSEENFLIGDTNYDQL